MSGSSLSTAGLVKRLHLSSSKGFADAATPRRRKQIVHTLLETTYVDSGEERPVVAIESHPEFAPPLRMTGPGEAGCAAPALDAVILQSRAG